MTFYANWNGSAASRGPENITKISDGPEGIVLNGTESSPIWFKITSATLVSPGIWTYTGDVYTDPFATAATSPGVSARNIVEKDNTSTTQSGYTIVSAGSTCGDFTGISPSPTGLFFKVCGQTVISGTTYYTFHDRNDPIVQTT